MCGVHAGARPAVCSVRAGSVRPAVTGWLGERLEGHCLSACDWRQGLVWDGGWSCWGLFAVAVVVMGMRAKGCVHREGLTMLMRSHDMIDRLSIGYDDACDLLS